MDDIKLRAQANLQIAWPIAWPDRIDRAEQFHLFWNAIGGAIRTNECGRRLVSSLAFSFNDGATLHVFVPQDWDDARVLEELNAIGDDVYRRCGGSREAERNKRAEWELTKHDPITLTIDADFFRREAARYQQGKGNGTSAGAAP